MTCNVFGGTLNRTLLYSTHADSSRVSIAIIASVILSVCLSVCPHDITRTAETKITKLGTGIVNHDTSKACPLMNIRSKVKFRVRVRVRRSSGSMSYAPISSAPLVYFFYNFIHYL